MWRGSTRFFVLLCVCLVVGGAGAPAGAWSRQQASIDAVATAIAILRSNTAPQLEQRIASGEIDEERWLSMAAVALMSADPLVRQELQTFLAATAQARGRRLGSSGGWGDEQLGSLLGMLLVDLRRFLYDSEFRERVLPVIRDGLPADAPAALRDELLFHLNGLPGFDFVTSEKVEVAWGAAPRATGDRELLFDPPDTPVDVTGAIEASVYSLPSAFFGADEAERFLRAVHLAAPERTLIVMSDQPLVARLRALAGELPLSVIDFHGRDYSPWPRDPFALRRNADGSVTVVVRPNVQAQRLEDVFMGRELVQGLPEPLDRRWGGVTWMVALMPFHNGHIVLTPGTTWVSAHTVQGRTLELMRLFDLAPGDLTDPSAAGRYVDAAQRAAGELELLYGQPVRFVHPMPRGEAAMDLELLLDPRIVRDLDSVLTLLPGAGGGLTALVGDVDLGAELVDGATVEEAALLGATYRLAPPAAALTDELGGAQRREGVQRFGRFLDAIADHLRAEGIVVERLPLLLVPGDLLNADVRIDDRGFLLSWNNVVIERVAGHSRAEGFSSLLPSAADAARRAYARAGYELELFPPLAMSVVRDGGYRCASNHLRVIR